MITLYNSETGHNLSGYLLIALILLPVIWLYIRIHKKEKAHKQQIIAEMEQLVTLPPVDAVYATVMKKDVFMEKNVESVEKIVRTHQLVYTVQFLTDSGEITEHSVPAELYDYITIGQKGILATVDGEFFDFDNGEEINI